MPRWPRSAPAGHREGAGRRHDNDRPASGGADIYKYILASGGADIPAGRPASGGADRRPGVAGLDGKSSRHRFIFDYINIQICCRCATDTID